jgi:hypothetical protein
MPNGAAALHLVPAPESKGEPPSAPGAGIEVEIGIAMANAACGLCFAVQEHQQLGALTSTTRTTNGERIARIYHLQQAHADKLDFPAVARAEGARVLRTHLDADFYRTHTGAGEWTINMIVDEVLAIVGRVTAVERAMAN